MVRVFPKSDRSASTTALGVTNRSVDFWMTKAEILRLELVMVPPVLVYATNMLVMSTGKG